MNTSISLHLETKEIRDLIIKTRIHDDGERYWIIKLSGDVSIFIEDDHDFRMLSEKISNALEDGGQKSESATSQCTPGPTNSASGEGSAGST